MALVFCHWTAFYDLRLLQCSNSKEKKEFCAFTARLGFSLGLKGLECGPLLFSPEELLSSFHIDNLYSYPYDTYCQSGYKRHQRVSDYHFDSIDADFAPYICIYYFHHCQRLTQLDGDSTQISLLLCVCFAGRKFRFSSAVGPSCHILVSHFYLGYEVRYLCNTLKDKVVDMLQVGKRTKRLEPSPQSSPDGNLLLA